MIVRSITDELLEILQMSPSAAITGARQVGKTTLAKDIARRLDRTGHYLDLEFPNDRAKLQDPVLFLEQYQDDCVILDEIHRMPELFPVLRSLIDRHRVPGRFLILGPASPSLLRDSSESLAGRISYIKLHPFTLLEVGDRADWQQLFVRGGFPESLLAPSDRASNRWRADFIQTYLERELPILGLGGAPSTLRKLLLLIAHAQAQPLNKSNIANALGVSAPTVASYIDFMEKAYLLHRHEPYFANIKKRLVKSPKIYIADSGIFHALLNLENYEALTNHPSLGPSWEGFVIQQTRAVLQDRGELWFYRTHEGAEADIVITRQDQPEITAEIKWTNAPTVSRGFRNVSEDLSTTQNYIITPTADTYPVAEHITVTSLKGWLEMLAGLKW